MFAVIKTGGKQYKVEEGEVLQVEKLNFEKGKKVKFDKILLIEDGDKTQIGTPFVKNAAVEAVVVENFKDKKVIVFKKKRRKQYRKTKGHRQELTRVQIKKIVLKEKTTAKKKAADSKTPYTKKTVKKAAKKAAPKTKATAKKTTKPGKKTTSSSVKTKKPAKKATAAKTPAKKKAGKKAVTKTEKSTTVKGQKNGA